MYIIAVIILAGIGFYLVSKSNKLELDIRIKNEAIEYLHRHNQELERELNRVAEKEWTD